jgi:type I restriction enzyme S subunit
MRHEKCKGASKYKVAAEPDINELPDLPEGWTYATAEQLTEEDRAITYGVIKLGETAQEGVPVLRSSDVRNLHIDLQFVKKISPGIAAQYRRTFLQGGEVVMTVRGTLGGIAVVPTQCRGFNVSREVAMLALVEPAMAHTVAIFVASSPLNRWLMSRTKGIAYTGINIETLKALPIPVPPLNEQRRIAAEVDRQLSIASQLEAESNRALSRAEHTRKVILNLAFDHGSVRVPRSRP